MNSSMMINFDVFYDQKIRGCKLKQFIDKFKYLKNYTCMEFEMFWNKSKLGSVALVVTEGVAHVMGVVCEKAGQGLAHLLGDMMY